MRVFMTTTGSHGDVHPFVALGAALRRRGHEAMLAANPHFRPLVEDAGLTFLPLGADRDLRELASHPDVMHHWRGTRTVLDSLILPHLLDAHTHLPPLFERARPDVVLHHHICFAMPDLCRLFGIPCVSVVLAPVMWQSRGDPTVMLPIEPLRPSRARMWIRDRISPLMMDLRVDRHIRRFARAHGLPVPAGFSAIARGGDLNLALWSPHFRAPLSTDPPNATICGFPWHDRDAAQHHASDEVEAFLNGSHSRGPTISIDAAPERARADAPILFSLGTAAVHVAGRFYEHAAEACRMLGRRGMLLIGRAEVSLPALPPGVRAFTYLPFSEIMPRCLLSVHHGGIGTTAQALRSGRPMVIAGHAHDQFDNGARIERLGVGRRVHATKVTAHSLADAISSVLSDPGIEQRARTLAMALATEDGAEHAATAVESLVGRLNRGRTAIKSATAIK